MSIFFFIIIWNLTINTWLLSVQRYSSKNVFNSLAHETTSTVPYGTSGWMHKRVNVTYNFSQWTFSWTEQVSMTISYILIGSADLKLMWNSLYHSFCIIPASKRHRAVVGRSWPTHSCVRANCSRHQAKDLLRIDRHKKTEEKSISNHSCFNIHLYKHHLTGLTLKEKNPYIIPGSCIWNKYT